jgi:hypothetical protein
VSASETVKAIAVESGYANSNITAAFFVIGGTVPNPVFSPVGGTYATAQSVTVTDALTASTIYYTTDGSTPTTSSPSYSGTPILVSGNETLTAYATAPGYTASGDTSAVYVVGQVVPTPTITTAVGSTPIPVTVTIADSQPNVAIYYTLDGSTPTNTSSLYFQPFAVSHTVTVNAIAIQTGYVNSPMATDPITLNIAAQPPVFSPQGGVFPVTSPPSVSITDATPGVSIYYTTDGSTPTTSSNVYGAPISVTGTETIDAIASGGGYNPSPVASATYTIEQLTATPTISPNGGVVTDGQVVTLADSQSGASIYYTTDGSTPTSSSTLYTTPLFVNSSETLTAVAIASGYSPSTPASAFFQVNQQVPTPTVSPNGGSFSVSQMVTLTDSLNGAAIFYSTNASSATPTWTQYQSPIDVSSTETLSAFAAKTGSSTSGQVSATFTISAASPGSVGAGLQLISLPYSYPRVSLDTIFGYTGVKAAVWTGTVYAVTPTPPADSIVTGQGYWIRFPSAENVTLTGVPAPTNTPFVISLMAGWNMVGDPFTSSVSQSSLMFDSGTKTYAQATAGSSPLIDPTFYAYDSGSNSYETATSLSVDQGYWVYAYSTTDMDVPPPGG